jgi:hypothetical protein
MKTTTSRGAGFRRLAYALIITTTLAAAAPPKGWAMLAPSQTPAAESAPAYDRAGDMRSIQAALESKVVSQGLRDHGLTPQETQSRLDRLTDKQIHQLAMRSHGVAAGGDIIIGLLFLVLLVVLIIYLVKRI